MAGGTVFGRRYSAIFRPRGPLYLRRLHNRPSSRLHPMEEVAKPLPCEQGLFLWKLWCPSVPNANFPWRCGYATPFDISHSFPTATVALGLGVGLSLGYLSDFPGPPQFK